jgi:hypothetical protein
LKVEVSIGELVDKVTILEIKTEKFQNADKLANAKKEYELLLGEMERLGIMIDSEEYSQLKEVNLRLWQIEDAIRIEELKKNYGEKFIQLARSVFYENDERAALKKLINLKYGSELVEEKEYVEYK